MLPPFFSVIIPTFNSGRKLESTLHSVLPQPSEICEVIIVDACSTDGTVALLKGMSAENTHLKWVSEPDHGIYDAMNKAIGLSSGKYLYFLGAGDTLRTGVLEQVRQSAPVSGPALIYGDVWIKSSGRLHGGGGPYTAARLLYDAPCHQAIFYERSVFDILGRYETVYPVSADWAFNIRCFGDNRVQKIYLDAVIADFEGGGLSANGPEVSFLRDRTRLVREGLAIETRGDLFFAADQFLALRIAKTRTQAARKFWRVLRGSLHLTHPGTSDVPKKVSDMRNRHAKQKRSPASKPQAALYRFAARILRRIGKELWVFGSTRKAPPPLLPLAELLAPGESASRSIPTDWTISQGRKLRNPFLSAALADDKLGAWALDAETINFLEQQIVCLRPRAILEFGCGLSTLCFARFMQEQGTLDSPCVYSIEQDERQAQHCIERLTNLGLNHLVKIHHAPLATQTVEGIEIECYDLPANVWDCFFKKTRPGFIVIDGPAGHGLTRYGVLPLIRQHLTTPATFFLDDAFRAEEMEVARHWSQLPYIHITGIYRVGKGLLAGTIEAIQEQSGR